MSQPNQPVVWIDGALREPHAGLHWSDHGITVGDGVFETIKLVGNRPFALEPHLDRLAHSAGGLGLGVPSRKDLDVAIAEVAAAWAESAGPSTLGRLRITVTGGPGPMGSDRGDGGPTLMVTAGDMELRRTPAAVVVVPWTRNEQGAVAGLKTTSYAENVVALARAKRDGAEEAIFANTRGELCEGTGANVFVGVDGALVTPPLDSGCLAGVTRALVIEALAGSGVIVQERPLPVAALADGEEAFLTSTGREVQPVGSVDGDALPAAPGPLTLAAQSAWDDRYA
ncbi:MAG: 4-amino-4-deoxychorismate lyase [Actinomycetia bacterium]|nr:4-amino-4-deoxychorismate lyase [Actinomycetes bacterium]